MLTVEISRVSHGAKGGHKNKNEKFRGVCGEAHARPEGQGLLVRARLSHLAGGRNLVRIVSSLLAHRFERHHLVFNPAPRGFRTGSSRVAAAHPRRRVPAVVVVAAERARALPAAAPLVTVGVST